MENIDSLMKLESKIAKCAKDITKVDKNKKGFNFTYEDPNAIKTNAYEQFAKNKLMLDAPKWMVNPVTGKTADTRKEGKEFTIEGTIILTLIDLETGFRKEYFEPGLGAMPDPMQAKGAAESYAIRQFLTTLLMVTIEKDIEAEYNEIMVYDKTGEPVPAASQDQINTAIKIVTVNNQLKNSEDDTHRMKVAIAFAISNYNKKYNTTHMKLSTFPSTEFDDLLPYIKAARAD